MILHYFLICTAIFSIVCIFMVLFFERKNPASSLVWVLVLLFLPGAGFIFYLFLGTGFRISKRKRYTLKAINDSIYDKYILKRLNLERSSLFLAQHEDAKKLLTYLRNQGGGVLTDNNAVDIFIDGREMFPRLLEDLRGAKKHIHLLFYIFRNDSLGKEIVSILTEKAGEGVEVRIIYDSVGTLMARDTMFHELKAAGGKVSAFAPIFSSLNSHLRLNYRNHRKIAVIDGSIGYLGGMNIGVEYMGGHPRMHPWRDTHLRITGSATWLLQERFIMDWAYCSASDPHAVDIAAYFPEPGTGGAIPVQIVSSGPDTFESPIKSGMLDMIYGARKTIFIQTPYFAPDESFFEALRIAAHSGVDVRLMLPQIWDYRIVYWATMGYAREMHELGVKIYLHNGFIHSKTIVVDGRVASIGSTNITNRSFTLDFEINAFIYDRGFGKRCEDIFIKDMENSRELPAGYFSSQGMLKRASYNFARMFSPMM